MDTKIIGMVAVICVFGYYVYEAPSNNNSSNNVIGALKAASRFSGDIREGRKKQLERFVTGAAEARLESDAMPSFRDVAVWSELSKQGVTPPISHYLWKPAVAVFERPSDSVELMVLEHRGSFYSMTFRGLVDDWSSMTVFRDGQPLLISVAVRYYSGGDDNYFLILLRKIFNLSWMPDFLKSYGEKGGWLLSDYRYTFTTREYFDWVKANGPRLYAQAKLKNAAAKANMQAAGFLEGMKEEALDQLEKDEAWAAENVERHIRMIGQQLLAEEK